MSIRKFLKRFFAGSNELEGEMWQSDLALPTIPVFCLRRHNG